MRDMQKFGYKIKVTAEAADDWMDRAACKGMMTTDIDPALCHTECEVMVECGLLFRRLEVELRESTRGVQGLAGVWGGQRRAHEPRVKAEDGRFVEIGAEVEVG